MGPKESDRSSGDGIRNIEKKDSPTTLDGEIERMVVQKRQKRAVRERVRPGKQLERLEVLEPASSSSWKVDCDRTLYKQHVYDSIPGCSPGPTGPPCMRLVVDNVASPEEQVHMVETMDKAFEGLFHQGPQTLLVPESDSAPRMGMEGFLLTSRLLERVRLRVAEALNISEVFYSGSLLKRMDYPPLQDDMQLDLNYDANNPHVDKANIASYDWSALLYFNSVGKDYEGGELVFNDVDADRMVRPLAGRMIAFSSGMENLHRVQPMVKGSRYVLSMWFTCSEKHAHAKLGLTKKAGVRIRDEM